MEGWENHAVAPFTPAPSPTQATMAAVTALITGLAEAKRKEDQSSMMRDKCANTR